MSEQSQTYLARQLEDANRELAEYRARAFAADRKEAQRITDENAVLAATIEARQTKERQDLQTAEIENWRRSCWVSYHITNAGPVGDATAFSSSFLNPRVDASMSDGAWAPGSSAADVLAPAALRREHPIEHLGEDETRMGRMLRLLK